MTTRRLIIGGCAATLASPGSFAGTTPPVDPADADLVRWLSLCGATNTRATIPTREQEEAEWAILSAADTALVRGDPSIMRAAAILLHELAFNTEGLTLPGGEAPVDGAQAESAQDCRMAVKVLRSLLPQLTGTIARLAADLINNPERAFCESLIARAYAGEVSL